MPTSILSFISPVHLYVPLEVFSVLGFSFGDEFPLRLGICLVVSYSIIPCVLVLSCVAARPPYVNKSAGKIGVYK